jgi:hypothetical protein
VSGAASQCADTIRIAVGRARPADTAASSAVHSRSSASGGAPWLRYSTGLFMRVHLSEVLTTSK